MNQIRLCAQRAGHKNKITGDHRMAKRRQLRQSRHIHLHATHRIHLFP
ncbi:MAG: hypothetical protein KF770_22430 [Anaerolineae bacterium]|nr:hypothetical protein [Anaerolineae bacterium]